MKKEVEVLVEVYDRKEDVISKFPDLQFKGEKETLDIYFYDPKRTELQPKESGQLERCFRLRQKDGKASIAYKIDRFENNIWLYSDEHETSVSDFKVMRDIVKLLGMEELVTIHNKKTTFENEKYEVVIEEVKDLGLFMEVERHNVDDSENIMDIKNEIVEWIEDRKINVSVEMTMGKPELMLRKIGAKNETTR